MEDSNTHSVVESAIERFFQLVYTRDPNILAEFAPGDDLVLAGSDDGEIARGRAQIKGFFDRIFARDSSYAWQMDHLDAFEAGDIAWFFADGHMIVDSASGRKTIPYRISGVLQHIGKHWLWKQYHGSEPVVGR